MKIILLNILLMINTIPIKDNYIKEDKSKNKNIQYEYLHSYYKEDILEYNIDENIGNSKINIFLKEPEKKTRLLDLKKSDSIEICQSKINKYRKIKREEIYNYNLEIAKKINNIINLTDTNIGEYSYTIEIELKNEQLTKTKIEQLESILKKDYISEIYISEVYQNESELLNMFPKINVDSMILSEQYRGRDINLGIIEIGGIADISAYPSDYAGRNIIIKPDSNGLSSHADHVTMIAAGNNGIARESNIYLSRATGDASEYLPWMVDNNVNVVNTSFGSNDDESLNGNGSYSSESKIADQIIKNACITIVGSAGNYSETNPTLRTSSPKTAYNYITVGNSGSSIQRRLGSSNYVELEGYGGSKPNIMAPGTTTTNASSGTGTSFASPQVAGCIALLMEEFPYLIGYPELILSIVTASASPMSSIYNNVTTTSYYDASGLHNEIGAGLLNYEKMREAARSCEYIYNSANNYSGMLDSTLEFNATSGQRVRASLAWLAHGTDTNNVTNYDLYLEKKNGSTYNVVKYINGITNNVEFIDYDILYDGTYRLSIRQKEQNIYSDHLGLSYILIDDSVGGSTSGGIETNYHEHTYTYTSISNTHHRGVCSCGDSIESQHVFKITALGTRKCIDCGKSGSTIIGGLNNTEKTHITENGSYILSNGVTYLVEEDVEAYLNGTLVFTPCNQFLI